MSKKWIIVYAVAISAIGLAVFALEYENYPKLQSQETLPILKTYSIIEFKLPDENASPLFPIYDKARDVIWAGDIKENSGRIWEFDLDSKTFVEHHLEGTNIITMSFLDSDGTIWYIDPTLKLLGHYNPTKTSNKLIKIPTNGTLSGLAVDLTGAVWVTIPNLDKILKYDIHANNFTTILPPTPHSSPLAIDIDKQSGYLWVDETIGKIAKLDPTNYKIIEYAPSGNELKLPVSVKIDPNSGTIYISEHGEDAVIAFYPSNETFKRLVLHPDTEALPYGMSFDVDGNLWVAQHTVNKLAVIDPRTHESQEVEIPSTNPLVQWLTSDSKGNIWMAEPGGAALALVSRSS